MYLELDGANIRKIEPECEFRWCDTRTHGELDCALRQGVSFTLFLRWLIWRGGMGKGGGEGGGKTRPKKCHTQLFLGKVSAFIRHTSVYFHLLFYRINGMDDIMVSNSHTSKAAKQQTVTHILRHIQRNPIPFASSLRLNFACRPCVRAHLSPAY